jgi:phosphate/sulfate permease
MALLAGFLMIAHALPAAKSTRHALAGSLFGFSLAAFVSNYPSVLIGYGAAPILGYGLALALAQHTRRD